MDNFYRIADLNFQITSKQSMPYLEMRMNEYKTVPCTPDIKVALAISAHIAIPDARIYAGRQLNFFETSDGGFGFFSCESGTPTRLVMSDPDFRSVTITVADTDIADAVFFTYLGMAFEMGASLHERIVLHSSSLVYKGKAVAFSAPPETGKSTHTRLWKKVFGNDVTIVNDDKPALRFDNDGIILFGTPWAGSTGINANVSAPLAAVVFLNRGAENSILPLAQEDCIKLFLEETPKPVVPRLMLSYLGYAERLIETAPSFALFCNMSDDAAITAKSGIFSD